MTAATLTLAEAVKLAGSAARLRAVLTDGTLVPRETNPMRFDRREVAEAVAEHLSPADEQSITWERVQYEVATSPDGLTRADREEIERRVADMTREQAERWAAEGGHPCACFGGPAGCSLCSCMLTGKAIERVLNDEAGR